MQIGQKPVFIRNFRQKYYNSVYGLSLEGCSGNDSGRQCDTTMITFVNNAIEINKYTRK